jgi:hypothetical protein
MTISKSKTGKNQGTELLNSNNFNKLKKYAKDNKIEILDSDNSFELRGKIRTFVENLEINKEKNHIFTYASNCFESPKYINFMGKQEFIEGKSVTIIDNPTNELLIFKLKGHPLFIEGEQNQEQIDDIIKKKKMDNRRKADKILKEDQTIQKNYNKKHA